MHHGKLPARTVTELVGAIASFPGGPAIKIPTLIMYGTADRLCPPAGSVMLGERIGARDTTLTPYDGLYHEILNEPEQEQVLEELCSWLAAHVAVRAELSDRADLSVPRSRRPAPRRSATMLPLPLLAVLPASAPWVDVAPVLDALVVPPELAPDEVETVAGDEPLVATLAVAAKVVMAADQHNRDRTATSPQTGQRRRRSRGGGDRAAAPGPRLGAETGAFAGGLAVELVGVHRRSSCSWIGSSTNEADDPPYQWCE